MIFWHIRSPLLIMILISIAFPKTIRDWNALPDSLISSAEGAKDGVAFSRDSWGLMSMVLVLVNDYHSNVSPVNNSDSDSVAFGYFLQIINWSPVDKSAQQVSNKKSNDIISRDTMHWTSDGFAYLYQWTYSCRRAGQFTSNFRSRTCWLCWA